MRQGVALVAICVPRTKIYVTTRHDGGVYRSDDFPVFVGSGHAKSAEIADSSGTQVGDSVPSRRRAETAGRTGWCSGEAQQFVQPALSRRRVHCSDASTSAACGPALCQQPQGRRRNEHDAVMAFRHFAACNKAVAPRRTRARCRPSAAGRCRRPGHGLDVPKPARCGAGADPRHSASCRDSR